MDWPISADALNRPVTVDSNRGSSAFFVKTADAPEPPGAVTWKENAAPERRSQKRSGLRRAAALSAATISLLIGGPVARFEPGFVGARAGSPPSTSQAAAQVLSLPPPDRLR